MVLNILALLASAILSWRLLKTFGWQTYKRVGASLKINKIYKIVLSLAIVLQLSFFFIVAFMGLWLDRLYNGPESIITPHIKGYKATGIVSCIVLIPWLVMGWFAVRREMKKTMMAFLVISALLLLQWVLMFVSNYYRLVFSTWTFFGMMSVAAAIVTTLALCLGVVCRLNFGQGLPHYLQNQELTEDISADGQYQDLEKGEKVGFPTDTGIPSFAKAFDESRTSHYSGNESPTHSPEDLAARTNPNDNTREDIATSRFSMDSSDDRSQSAPQRAKRFLSMARSKSNASNWTHSSHSSHSAHSAHSAQISLSRSDSSLGSDVERPSAKVAKKWVIE